MTRVRLIFERQWLHALLLAVLLAVAHQAYVWFCWRVQLHGGLLSRLFGGLGFYLYAAGFSVLGIARVLVVFILAVSNRDTLAADPVLLKLLGAVVLVPALYLFYSVKRHFGFKRAFGIDHFDPDYRSRPFVRGGIFRFTRNAMYVFGFFLIWAHYFSTELPDMKRIYGDRRAAAFEDLPAHHNARPPRKVSSGSRGEFSS